jgi:Ca2+-binding EF-hand superfamily protein
MLKITPKLITMTACVALSATALVAHADETNPMNSKLSQSLVRQLLIVMDIDQSGQISKQEFMDYMSNEFDKLDVNKSGELDISELKMLRYKPNASHSGGGSK